MNFDKLDVINSIKLYKNLNKKELDYLLYIRNNLDISDDVKKTLNILDNTSDYYNVIKVFNDRYEKIRNNDEIKLSKPTKTDVKNIIKFFDKYDNSKINEYVENPDLLKDESIKNTFYKLRLHKNPIKFMDDCFNNFMESQKGGVEQTDHLTNHLERTSDKLEGAQNVIESQNDLYRQKIEQQRNMMNVQVKELRDKKKEYIDKLKEIHKQQLEYINSFWEQQEHILTTNFYSFNNQMYQPNQMQTHNVGILSPYFSQKNQIPTTFHH